MSFVSLEFYIFFVAVFAAYALLPHRFQNILLLFASYFFYAYWDWRFSSLLLLVTVTDFVCARNIERSSDLSRKKRYLAVSLAVNLTVLGIFKYLNFFIAQFDRIFSLFGWHPSLLGLHIIFPLGISFYIFQSMSYTIDVYRGYCKPTGSFTDYALFVSFFPQLVAGPIERSDHLLPQVQGRRTVTFENIKWGVHLIFWGLFKKLFVADSCAVISDNILLHHTQYSGAEILVGMYAFAFRMYGDISGYTDIARGTAKCMGFDLSINFHLPYFATNISEFWRRWHISVTGWFRDYVFSPILVTTKGNVYISSFITLFGIAIWHSLSVNSIMRGFYFGLMVAGYYLLKRENRSSPDARGNGFFNRASPLLSGIATFHLVCVGWLFLLDIKTAEIPRLIGRVLYDFNPSSFAPSFLLLLKYVWPLLLVQTVQAVRKDEFFIFKAGFFPRVLFYVVIFLLLYGINGGVVVLPFVYFKY